MTAQTDLRRCPVVKGKLISLGARHASVGYEISLRGTWPEARYTALRTTLIDLAALLSQLQFILSTMDLPWRRALLKRTQLNDTRFVRRATVRLTRAVTLIIDSYPLPLTDGRRACRLFALLYLPSLGLPPAADHALPVRERPFSS